MMYRLRKGQPPHTNQIETGLFRIFVFISLLFCHAAWAGNVTLSLVDGETLSPLADYRVDAYVVSSSGSAHWKAKAYSSAEGVASFALPDLAASEHYRFKTKVFNNYRSELTISDSDTSQQWPIGSFRATILDGTTPGNPPLAETGVSVQYLNDEGKYKWYTGITTDTSGVIRLDLPGLNSGTTYRLSAKSPINGQSKYSDAITAEGPFSFIVGNAPLAVRVKDATTQSHLSDIEVTAYEKLADGSNRWTTRLKTDAQGLVQFDLDGLGSGRNYYLKTSVYNGFTAYSDLFTTPAETQWMIGDVQVTVKNGNTQPAAPLADQEVYIERFKEDGKFGWFSKATTDAQGQLKLNLPALRDGQRYRLKTKSPLDNSTKYGPEITQAGSYDFVVGNLPLSVVLVDDETRTPLSAVSVTVYERLADGGKKWHTRKETDNSGALTLDLEGLGDGRTYYLYAKPFNSYAWQSQDFTQPGDYQLALGTVRVTVLNGSSSAQNPLADTKVTISRLNDEGKWKWFGSAVTDTAGKLRIDLPELNGTHSYRLSTASTVSGETQYSDPIVQAGNHVFLVGNPPVTVRLLNALSGQTLPNQEVTVYRKNPDGSNSWITRRTTDAQGLVTFDLSGITAGTEYYLKTQPYNGGYTYSSVITSYGQFDFSVGGVPVRLFDETNQNPIVNQKVTAYIAQDDGGFNWYKQATTDTTGAIIFDLEGLRTGDRYVLKTSNPFGENKHYYSGVIVAEGPFAFGITQGDTDRPDTEFPELAITDPVVGQEVSSRGFVLSGTASDNNLISQISATISPPGQTATTLEAEYSAVTGLWQLAVAQSLLVPDSAIELTITALDGNNNATSLSAIYQVGPQITDVEAPTLALTSHVNGSAIPKTGVIFMGTVADDVAVTSLVATAIDGSLGTVFQNQTVQFDAQTGQWELVLRNGQLTPGQSLQVQLTAGDEAGHTTTITAAFPIAPVEHEAEQMLSRLTFGSTPDLRNRIQIIGASAFLQEQLNPNTIDNSVFDLFIAGYQPQSLTDLRFWAIQHMLFSERQLQEVLTQFWENHFNTNFYAHDSVALEVAENNGFRQHALGRFRDLLEVSAKSPAMIYYLNNAENVQGAPNENYARELLELHTVGVDGGYTSTDIAELAKVFTGWHVQNNQFFFNAAQHDYTSKVVMGTSLSGTGLSEGETMLDVLAMHPATIARTCEKLAVLLVSEAPAASTLSACEAAWQTSNGRISTAVEALVQSPEFSSASNFRSKIKTPLELLSSVIRNYSANFSQSAMDSALRNMGMTLFSYPVPTGNSEDSADWINSNLILQRNRFVNQVAFNFNASSSNYIDVMQLISDANLTSAEAIVAFFFDIAMGGDYTETEFQIGLEILNDNGVAFDRNAPEAEILLRRLLGHVMSFPGYQFQ